MSPFQKMFVLLFVVGVLQHQPSQAQTDLPCVRALLMSQIQVPLAIEEPALYQEVLNYQRIIFEGLEARPERSDLIQRLSTFDLLLDEILKISPMTLGRGVLGLQRSIAMLALEPEAAESVFEKRMLLLSSGVAELVVAFEVWGLKALNASSAFLYPEKEQNENARKQIRSVFKNFIGEIDIIFAPEAARRLGAQAEILGIGEVKALRRQRQLTKDEKRQAENYARYARLRTEMGYPAQVTYFFPLEAPSKASIKFLRSLGILVKLG